MRWDRLLLDEYGMQRAIEVLGPVVPGLLEFLYLLTYALAPIGLVILAACKRLDRSPSSGADWAGNPRGVQAAGSSRPVFCVLRSVWCRGLRSVSVFPIGASADSIRRGIA